MVRCLRRRSVWRREGGQHDLKMTPPPHLPLGRNLFLSRWRLQSIEFCSQAKDLVLSPQIIAQALRSSIVGKTLRRWRFGMLQPKRQLD